MNIKKLSLVVFAVILAFGLAACNKPGTAEKAGEKIDKAAEKAGDKIEDATDKAGEKMERAGDKIENATDK